MLDVRGSCGVLVTSRRRKDAAAEWQDVRPLPSGEAVVLLRAWGKGQAADEAAAQRLCALAGRLPLAGRYLDEAGETAAEYLEWLEETPLQALDHGRRRLESVPVLLAKSLAQVGEGACHVLAVVGLLALAPFNREPIAAALDLSPNRLRKPLGELVSYGLLLRHSSPRPSSPSRAGGTRGGVYPWGDEWDETKCNTVELGLRETTTVGIFPEGASPYGCLDMAGNVWEWTSSQFKEYPYDPADGREDLKAEAPRVLRGGSFVDLRDLARCAFRARSRPHVDWRSRGFRVVVSPFSSSSAL